MRQTILEIVKKRVAATGLSRREIAKEAGVSKSWLDKVMSGHKTNPQLDQIQALIFALDRLDSR